MCRAEIEIVQYLRGVMGMMEFCAEGERVQYSG